VPAVQKAPLAGDPTPLPQPSQPRLAGPYTQWSPPVQRWAPVALHRVSDGPLGRPCGISAEPAVGGAEGMGVGACGSNSLPSGARMWRTGVAHSTDSGSAKLTALRDSTTAASTGEPVARL
jgi:hypothetical protein